MAPSATGAAPRVVSLLPGATEVLAALGCEPVGVSHECDYPPGVTDLPNVTRSRIDTAGPAAAVDAAVSTANRDGGVLEIDRSTLAALSPDVVLTQAVCEVCAVDRVAVEAAIEDLGLDATVCTIDVHSLADLGTAIERIGAAVDREATATTVARAVASRFECLSAATGAAETGPRVAVLDWPDPPMVAGHWVPELVELVGGQYGLAEPGAASRPREWAAIRDYDPAVLVVSPCGFGLERAASSVDTLRDRPGWDELAAVREQRVVAMDGNDHLNRAGPRLVRTAELLAGVVDEEREPAPTDELRFLAA